MRQLAHLARCWALVALALLPLGEPVLAQEPQPDTRASAPNEPREGARVRPIERRGPLLRKARPLAFDQWARELHPAHRRALARQLRRMPAPQQDQFFRGWERMSTRERREFADTLGLRAERRHQRELPPRLRTPEMRDRLEQMSPQERQRFFARARDWREMKPAERHRMRARLAKFGALSDPEQSALVEKKFARRTPEERAKILRDLREASQQRPAPGAKRGNAGAPEAGAKRSNAGAGTPPAIDAALAPDAAPARD